MTHSKFFSERGYILSYHAIHPVFRNRRVYAIASPLGPGATAVFENKEHLDLYIVERSKNEQMGICQ